MNTNRNKANQAMRDLRELPRLLAKLEKDFAFLEREKAHGKALGSFNYPSIEAGGQFGTSGEV